MPLRRRHLVSMPGLFSIPSTERRLGRITNGWCVSTQYGIMSTGICAFVWENQWHAFCITKCDDPFYNAKLKQEFVRTVPDKYYI